MPDSAGGPTSAARPLGSRSTRDRPAKAPLSEDAVVDAALRILKSDGPEAVSMRRVAQALDTGPASLYVYVRNREGLVNAMLDRVVAKVELETPDPSRWRTRLHALLDRLHGALVAHPGMAAMTLAEPPATDAILLFADNLLDNLLAGGLTPQAAAWGCDILVALVYAAAREDDVRRTRGDLHGDERAEHLRVAFADLPADRFPALREHAGRMVAGTSDQRRRFAVDVVLDGLAAVSSSPP